MNKPVLNSVFIITCADRQKDGTFVKHIQNVYTTIELGRAELARIAATFNCGVDQYVDWRAERPQLDDLSLELLVGNHYQCQSFYRLRPYDIKA